MDVGFDLNLMRLLVALAETRNVTRAARAMHMSQSGFSTALAKLRRQLGDELFVRTPSGMEPTARAQRAIETARAVLDTVRHGILEQPEFDPATSHAEFRLAMQETAELVFLPQLLQHLQQLAPDAAVSCAPFTDRALQSAMAAGEVDLALGYYPELDAQSFFHQRLYLHTYACLLRRDHPVLESGFTEAAFRRLGHVALSTPAASLGVFQRWLEQNRIERRVVLRTSHLLSLPAIIESTDLIATVPVAVAERFSHQAAIVVLPVPVEPPFFPVQQHWHRAFHQEPRIRWLRGRISGLFNDQSDRWRQLEAELYGRSARVKAGTRRRRKASARNTAACRLSIS